MRKGRGCRGSPAGRKDCGAVIQKRAQGLAHTYGEGMGRQHPVLIAEESSSIQLPQGAHDGATLARSDLLGGGTGAPNAATPSLGVFQGHCEDPPMLLLHSLTLHRTIATFSKRQSM